MPAYSKPQVATLLTAVDAAGANADAKGTALEDLSKYLFETVPGVQCIGRNILDGPRAHELDLAFWVSETPFGLGFLEAVLIVECKAAGAAVGSAQVAWYAQKLRTRASRHGILVALNGITGAADGVSSAHSEVIGSLRDGVRILLLNRDEIVGLDHTDDLVALMKSKLLRLTLERVVQVDGA